MRVKLDVLLDMYNNDIFKNVKNKKKIYNFEKNKIQYLIYIKDILETNTYDGGKYNIFLIKTPKERIIMSQNMIDKIINHYVAKKILLPKLEKYLMKENCATRKNMGTSYAIKQFINNLEKFKSYEEFYVLKLDIKKYFYSIDHNVLKNMLKDIFNEEEYNLISKIINSTNHNYINNKISKLNKFDYLYNYDKGLPIGNMTSQILAVFYLSKVHHYIKHNLGIKYFTVYMDDYVLLHKDKEYLKKILHILEEKLYNEYKLKLNESKTKIYKISNGVCFLGHKFIVKNKKTITLLTNSSKKNIVKGLKRDLYLLKKDDFNFNSIYSSLQTYKYSYKFVKKTMVKNIFLKYF